MNKNLYRYVTKKYRRTAGEGHRWTLARQDINKLNYYYRIIFAREKEENVQPMY